MGTDREAAAQAARRRCVLLSLWAADHSTASVRDLVQELDRTHNLAASRDQVRGDLSWLQEQGFARLKEDTAQLTERGTDVALRRAPWPGE
jgi:hypothetical protein